MNTIEQSYFPRDTFHCYFEEQTTAPLVVSPCIDMDFIAWARKNQPALANAIKEFGAVVFSGFSLTQEHFSEALTAITGLPPQSYVGDSSRKEVTPHVYQSTAVGNAYDIPPHQEGSAGCRKSMPRYISFFCVTPPTKGTGQTLVGNVLNISKKIQALAPQLWELMTTKTLTYTIRYLPKNSWLTKWIRWLNPSHAMIEQRFGTENRAAIEAQCQREGLTCAWDGNWAVISRKGVPATINDNGTILFCNQIHLDKLNRALCGGWVNYILARTFLYPTRRLRQFDVECDDRTQISPETASTIVDILKEDNKGRNWQKGDLMVVDNVRAMHAKTKHVGQREILVAMRGAVIE